MKDLLIDNAKSLLIKTLRDDLDQIEQNANIVNQNTLEALQADGIPSVALTEITLDEMLESRDTLDKKNYHFPDVISLGTMENYHYTPSRILENEIFPSKIPLIIPIRDFGMAFFLNHKYKDRINNIIEQVGLKMLLSVPDGLARVTLIDKTGSGQNFPTLSTLHEKFLNGKILSEDNEIESELESLKQSMSTITQNIAANGFSSIEHFNKDTDEVPQHYTFLFVSGFPTGFNKKSSENLLALIESGPKAGIYVFLTIAVDPSYGPNQNVNGMTLDQFIKSLTVFELSNRPHEYVTRGWIPENIELYKIPLTREKEFINFFNNTFKPVFKTEDETFTKTSISELNKRIEKLDLRPVVDIEKAIPPVFWTKDAGKGVAVPFGKQGIQNVFFCLGINQYDEDETTHHGLACGATGSGKTVFIHDIILQIAMNYSPRDVQFYLLDYKEGTEFAVYKDFPYVNILSMESEIEFGQEVLEHAIDLMKKRGALFKEKGVANLHGYNNAVSEDEKLPRIIIIIDEFQALLPKDPKVSARTNERLDKILRLGRSFGINLLLATQTLKGIDLDPAILSNMPLRIALRMDEKDATKIFGEGNHAPKFLKNPGEGIYNKAYGNSRNNVHFQAFKALGNTVDNLITRINKHVFDYLNPEYISNLYENRFVYNGTEPGSFERNEIFKQYINDEISTIPGLYIGESAGLTKEHEFLSFKQEFADNLIMVGSDQQKAASVFFYMITQELTVSDESIVYLLNYNNQLEQVIKNEIINEFEDESLIEGRFIAKGNKDSEDVLQEIYEIFLTRKEENENSEEEIDFPSIYFYNFFIESGKIFNSSGIRDQNIEKIQKLIKEGPELGIHLIIFAADFSTLTSNDLARDLSKFRKKIAFIGGNSLKLFGTDSSVKFSDGEGSVHVAILNNGEMGSEPKKFKPYVYDIFHLAKQEEESN